MFSRAFKPEPCPEGTPEREWSTHQNELRKEHDRKEPARVRLRVGIFLIVVGVLAAVVVVFVYRDAPEPVSEDVRALAAALKVELGKREDSRWPTMDKETRAAIRTTLIAAIGIAVGYVFRDVSKPKEGA
jgi:hypothetical protein